MTTATVEAPAATAKPPPVRLLTNRAPWRDLVGDRKDRTIEEWKKEAHLDFTVGEGRTWFGVPDSDVKTPEGMQDFKFIEHTGKKTLYRTDTNESFAVVSRGYKTVQPGQILDFFESYVKDSMFTIESAGIIGRKIFALAEASESFQLGSDVIKRYALLATSYDTSITTQLSQTSIRVYCDNTLTAALNEGRRNGSAIKLSHRVDFKDGQSIKDQLALNTEWKSFTESIARLARAKMSRDKVMTFVTDLFFPPSVQAAKEFSKKGMAKRVDQLMVAYDAAPGQQDESAKGTMWGALNAVTYFVDHLAGARTAQARLDKAWFGEGAVRKQRAMERLLVLANN